MVERFVARSMAGMPKIKAAVKWAYQRGNYVLYSQRGRTYELHPGASMRTVYTAPQIRSKDSFFGYFDKCPWSADGRSYLIQAQLTDEAVEIILVHGNSVSLLGRTTAWNWQQGAMLQWCRSPHVPYSVCWNEVRADSLGSCWRRENGETRFLPWPIQALSPTRPEMLSLNYKRLFDLRPEYGYAPEVQNFDAGMPLDADGLWLVDVDNGNASLLLSLAHLKTINPISSMDDAVHKVNHALYSPRGDRFVFMHRWIASSGKWSRLYVANRDGSALQLLLDDRMVSHYSWRDENHLVVWARTKADGDRYYLIDVRDGSYAVIGKGIVDRFGDGHPSYSPDGRWIVTDTYPDKGRRRHLLLFDTVTDEVVNVAWFFAPWKYDGLYRCDLHPRWSPDGSRISVDSAHEGTRKSYVVDISAIIS